MCSLLLQLVEITFLVVKYFSQSCGFRCLIAFMNINFVYWFHYLINITKINQGYVFGES